MKDLRKGRVIIANYKAKLNFSEAIAIISEITHFRKRENSYRRWFCGLMLDFFYFFLSTASENILEIFLVINPNVMMTMIFI